MRLAVRMVFVGRVRVYGDGPAPVCGAGILLASNVVITCREVITDVLGRTRSTCCADFPDAPAQAPITATVSGESEAADLVALALAEPAPVSPAQVVHGTDESRARVFGYPRAVPTGVWVRAAIGAQHAADDWRRLEFLDGAAVEPGFGGAGVHEEAGYVIGIVAVRPARFGHLSAWLVPVAKWPAALSRRQDGWAFGETGAQLTFSDKHALAKALGEVPVVADPEGRRLIVQSLPANIRAVVPNHAITNLELFGLVDAVLAFDGGFEALYSVIATVAGETALSVVRVRLLATRLGLLVSA